MLNEKIIKDNLIDKSVDIIVKQTTNSTNDDAKEYIGKNTVVIAENQDKGRGRLNRTFYSPKGKGIYMSMLINPNLSISDGVKITTFIAVAVAKSIEKLTNLTVGIKWVNDLYINGKKVCGILTEAGSDFQNNKLKYAVCGIGINCYGLDFPLEISNIATSLEKEGAKVDRNALIAEIINQTINIEEEILSGNYLAEYKNRLIMLNKEITVYTGGYEYKATAVDVTENGGLVVIKNGEKITVNSGEVSIKL